MAKVLGTEQETEARAPAVNPKEYSIRQYQSFDIGEATQGLQKGLTDYVKAEQKRGLGVDVAKANEMIQSINNPIERELAAERAKNNLQARYGSDYFSEINSGIRVRKLSQTVDAEGNIVTIDDSTKQPVGFKRTEDISRPEQVFQRRMERNSPVMSANLPNFTDAISSLATDITGSGGRVGLGDALGVSDKAISSFQNLKRNVEIASAIKMDTSISSVAAADQRKIFAQQARNDAIGVLQSLRNATLSREIGRTGSLITPEKAMTAAQAYITDITSQFAELGADKALGVDMYTFTKDLNEVAKTLGEYYDTVASGDVKRTKRMADVSKNTVDFYTNNVILEMRERSPQAFNTLAQAPALQALTNALTAMDTLSARGSTFGPMGSRISNNITDILFGAQANESIFAKLERREIRTPSDLNTTLSDFEDVLSRGGAAYIDDFKALMEKNKPAIQSLDLSDKDKKRLDNFYATLGIKADEVKKTLEDQGVSEDEQKKGWKFLRDLGKWFSDDRKRQR